MIKKNFPIKKPYFYDTKEGIDYFTKLSIEENPKKLTPKELADIHKLNKDMKRSALEDHSKKLKKFDNLDPTTYPSDPVQRGTLLEIGKLEKDLEVPPGQRKPRRNIWDEYVKTGQLPELTAEERIRAKGPSDWDVVYGSMSPMEKGQWNAEQRRKKIQRQKEDEEERRQKRIANHTKQQWGIAEKKLTETRGWINEADNEKKQNEKKQEVITKKSLPGVQSILAIDTPEETTVTREETPSLNQRLRNSKVAVGLSPELLGLQKQINRNIDYVLGTDQKERLERTWPRNGNIIPSH